MAGEEGERVREGGPHTCVNKGGGGVPYTCVNKGGCGAHSHTRCVNKGPSPPAHLQATHPSQWCFTKGIAACSRVLAVFVRSYTCDNKGGSGTNKASQIVRVESARAASAVCSRVVVVGRMRCALCLYVLAFSPAQKLLNVRRINFFCVSSALAVVWFASVLIQHERQHHGITKRTREMSQAFPSISVKCSRGSRNIRTLEKNAKQPNSSTKSEFIRLNAGSSCKVTMTITVPSRCEPFVLCEQGNLCEQGSAYAGCYSRRGWGTVTTTRLLRFYSASSYFTLTS